MANDTQLLYSVGFNGSQFSGGNVQGTSYLLTDVPQGTALEITISPGLPFLGLTGPPFSSTANLGKLLLARVLNICVMSCYCTIHVYIGREIFTIKKFLPVA